MGPRGRPAGGWAGLLAREARSGQAHPADRPENFQRRVLFAKKQVALFMLFLYNTESRRDLPCKRETNRILDESGIRC